MRLIGRLLGIVLVSAIAIVIAVAVWAQDANRLKPELETLLSENSGYAVSIRGNVSWQLWPPLTLHIGDITAVQDEQTINAGAIDLKMDLSAMWEDIERWQVTELALTNTTLAAPTGRTDLATFKLRDFTPGTPADFTLTATYDPVDGEPVNATAEGVVTYFPAADSQRKRFRFAATEIVSDLVDGTCDADITTAINPPRISAPLPADALLPLNMLGAYDVSAQCAINRLPLGEETFRNGSVEITNAAGALDVLLEINDFLEGTLRTEVDVDTRTQPITWTIVPEINNVDSQRLLDWTDQRLQWIAHIGANSTLTMRGNTEAELIRSIRGSSEFDGGQGQLNISKIKAQLMRLPLLAGEAERVSAWPDIWNYETLAGRWNIEGAGQELTFALDHMSINAEGSFDYFTDKIDMLANVTVHEPADEANPFRINPLLVGTPIPIRCQGLSADPTCRLDQDAARSIVAKALTSGEDSGLRRKLEDKIEEDVPEEYRETARELLDILGRSLERN